MSALPEWSVQGDLAVFRPSGPISPEQAAARITAAIALAREQQVPKLLIEMSGWGRMRSPSVTERYFFVQEWARAAPRGFRMALVAPAELIDPKKFGATVARNSGLLADIFTSEHEAIQWLQKSALEARA